MKMKKTELIKHKTKKITKDFHWVKCPYCGKLLESEYIKQLNWNYKVHINNCKENPRRKEEQLEEVK